MSCNYCWNQPKRFGEYDLYLDGKIKADDFVYRVKNKETGKIESFSITEEFDTINERLKTHFTFDTSFKSYNELETAFNNGELKETVIYVVENETSSDNPDSKDNYNEYMIISVENEDGTIVKKLELIGSGSYAKQTTDLYQITGYTGFDSFNDKKQDGKDINSRINKEIADRIADVDAEEKRAIDVEKELDEKINQRVVLNDPITISKSDGTTTTTTSITDTSISTTTLTGTLDAESMKNSLTAEAVKAVVPIDWGTWNAVPTATSYLSVALGSEAWAKDYSTALGSNAAATSRSLAVGYKTKAPGRFATAMGNTSEATSSVSITIGSAFEDTSGKFECATEGTGSITIGAGANTKNPLNPDNKTSYKNSDGEEVESSYSITIGQKAENYSPQNVVIGANAKAINSTKTVNGVEETVLTSNSVTIGYDASNKGADSVVIGAQAKGEATACVCLGVEAETQGSGESIAIGNEAKSNSWAGVAIGSYSKADNQALALGRGADTALAGTAVGAAAKAMGRLSAALGYCATVSDYGATVIRSTASDGIYTQLYFSGQNTPLALKYYPTEWEKKQDVDDQGNPKVDENGEPVMVDDKDKPTKGQAMMGYVVSKVITNEEGKQETKVLECGTNLLAALFPNHGLGDNPFQPTTTAIDGEIISFHPSDIDMPIEDTNVNVEEDYKSLPLSPIYPIVEPEIEEL